MKVIGVLARPDLVEAGPTVRDLVDWLDKRGVRPCLDAATAALGDVETAAALPRGPGTPGRGRGGCPGGARGRRHPARRQPAARAVGAGAGRQLRQPGLPDRDRPPRALPDPRSRPRRPAPVRGAPAAARGGAAGRQARRGGRRPERRGDHEGGRLEDHRARRERRRPLRLRVPRRRPDRLLSHRIHGLQPGRGRAAPPPDPPRDRPDPDLPAHADQSAPGGGRRRADRGASARRRARSRSWPRWTASRSSPSPTRTA